MQIKSKYRYAILLLVLLFQGCATTAVNHQLEDFDRPDEYVRFFEILDRMVVEADVRNAASFPVAGFPYLRTNRFLTGLKAELHTGPRKEQWIRMLQQLDFKARKKEIQNLPQAAVVDLADELDAAPDRKILQERMADYSDKLMTHDQRRSDYLTTVQAAVTNFDEYRTAYRVMGIYPITALPVEIGRAHV